MSLPIKSDALEVVSGGAANPSVTSGTADPTLGLSRPEGSIYLRYVVSGGQAFVKFGPLNTDWDVLATGGGGIGGSLDDAYDFGGPGGGRIIAADSGAVRIDAGTNNSQAALHIQRLPGAASAAVGIDLALNGNVNASGVGIQIADAGAGTSLKVTKSNAGSVYFADLTDAGAKGLEVVVTAAPTSVAPVSIVANTTGTTADLLSVSKIPGGATAGNAINVSMGANASGSAIRVSHAGSGAALEVAAGFIQVANNAAAVSPSNQGRLRYNSGTQTFQVSMNGAAYADITTGASFTLDIGDSIGSSTVGSVLFVGVGGVLQQDNANFFWDNTNDSLQVTSTSGSAAVFAKNSSTTAGAMAIQNTNVSGPVDFYAMDNGGTARMSWGYGNASYSDAARASRAYSWRNTGVDFVFARTSIVDVIIKSDGKFGIGTQTTLTQPFDVEAILGNTNAKFGSTLPIYIVSANPNIGMNAYFNSGWKFGKGSSGSRGATVAFDPVAGDWALGISSNTGSADAAVTMVTRLNVSAAGVVSIPALTTGSVPFVGAGGAITQDNTAFFWDATLKRLMIRQTGADPLDGGGIITLQNSNAGGNSEIYWRNAANSFAGVIGYDNISAQFNFYTQSSSITLSTNAGAFSWTFSTDGALQISNGGSAAVSLASTGRLRYTTSGQKFQVSANADSYFDVGTYATTPLVAGAVLFANSSNQIAQNNPFFTWDNTQHNLGVASDDATESPFFVQSIVTTGPSAMGCIDSSTVFKSYWGYFNSTYAFTYMRSKNGVLAIAGNIIFGNSTIATHEFGMTANSLFFEMFNGGSAAVSSANAGRLRYNTTGQKFQVSMNGAAYVDLQTGADFTLDIGDAIGSSSIGSVLFVGAGNVLQQDNANFFWDDTNNRLGIGTAAPSATLHVKDTEAFTTAVRLEHTATSGISGADLIDSAAAYKGSIGYAGSATTITHIQSKIFIHSAGPDVVITNATNAAFTFGMTASSIALQMQNGSGAAIGAASTGKLIYNTTGQKFQVSVNGSSYIDLSPGVERLSADGAADPVIQTTFISGTGTDLTLANGAVDGFIKNFVVTGGTGTVTPANLADGDVLTWTATPANVSFIWDATGTTWHVYGNPYNMVTT